MKTNKIFELQNRLTSYHRSKNPKWTSFIEACLELCLDKGPYCIDKKECDKESFAVFEPIFQDSLSVLINSYRVGLFGCYADAVMLCRLTTEEFRFLDSSNQNNEYRKTHQLLKNKHH